MNISGAHQLWWIGPSLFYACILNHYIVTYIVRENTLNRTKGRYWAVKLRSHSPKNTTVTSALHWRLLWAYKMLHYMCHELELNAGCPSIVSGVTSLVATRLIKLSMVSCCAPWSAGCDDRYRLCLYTCTADSDSQTTNRSSMFTN